MTYSVIDNKQQLEIVAYNRDVLLEVLSKLPKGEYTVSVNGVTSRNVTRRCKSVARKVSPHVYRVLEVSSIALSLLSSLGLWILFVALAA